ncbi:MAG: T9SS type A sorting domain-containing protein [Ignavibacteriales bacterium]|nr:T9SS type A sorting domain-containing protein [Ignavibacteriales bacterium]
MKTRVILLLIGIPLLLNAQYKWNNSRPSAYPLNDIFFVNALVGWTVGNYSTCLKTIDGGVTWEPIKIPVYSNLQKVVFVDENIGWIIGGETEGPILKTIDGGKNWNDSNPTKNGWVDLCVISKDLLFASGVVGVYKSINGGKNWKKSSETSGWASTLFFLDSLNGWFCNTVGDIYKTTDSGTSWNLLKNMKYTWHKRIKFVNKRIGYLVSAGLYSKEGKIYKTIDGGITWEIQDSVTGQEFNNLEVKDSLNAVAIGDNDLFRYTEDGGEIWYSDYISNESLKGITINSDKFWIVGGNALKGKIYSGNYFNNWTELSKLFTTAELTDMDFYDKDHGICVGIGGAILKTTDNGKAWENLDLVSFDLSSISYLDKNNIFISGRNGAFVKTSDGGISWEITFPFQKNVKTKIKFHSPSLGYIFYEHGNLAKTTDGGANWFIVKEYENYDFTFADSMNLWLLSSPLETDYSEIYHSQDGGNNWTTNELPYFADAINFVDEQRGWLSSENKLYRTNDGGTTWNVVNENLPNIIDRILFIDDKLGFLLTRDHYFGNSVAIQYTMDGGENFKSIIDFSQIYDLTATSNKIWGYDQHGHILEIDLDKITDIDNVNNNIANKFSLEQNYPNPFNPTTMINYSIPNTEFLNQTFVEVKIYDVLGREIKTLVNKVQNPGNYQIEFDGSSLSTGVYLYVLKVGGYVEAKKMLLLK